jgi:hypothetical protein
MTWARKMVDKNNRHVIPIIWLIGGAAMLVFGIFSLLSNFCLCIGAAKYQLGSTAFIIIGFIDIIIYCSYGLGTGIRRSGASGSSEGKRSSPVVGGSLILAISVVSLVFIMIFWEYALSNPNHAFQLMVMSWIICSIIGIIGGIFAIGRSFFPVAVIGALCATWASLSVLFILGLPVALVGLFLIASGEMQFERA